MGQIIGIVVAEDRLTAQRAAKSVKVTYNELPTVFTIEVTGLCLAEATTCILVHADYNHRSMIIPILEAYNQKHDYSNVAYIQIIIIEA